LNKVLEVLDELRSIRKKMEDPEIYKDTREYSRLARRLKQIEPLEAKEAEYLKLLVSIEDEKKLSGDSELKTVAIEEAQKARARMPQLLNEIKRLLIPPNPDDRRSVILEVRAGTGGEEAALFAAEQLKMYMKYAERRGFKTELLSTSEADAGGVKEASARIEGAGAFGELKWESGVHRVQRIPETEAKGRIHTSTTTVAILPEAEEVDIEVKPEDLKIDTYRSGGAGGQHVNKTESAVRITHLPTGVVVACQSERSQIKNRALAMSVLRSRLYAAEKERQERERTDLRSGQVGSADRSEKIRTYNFPQDRITDHRINKNFSNLPGIMQGNLGEIIGELRNWEEERRLRD